MKMKKSKRLFALILTLCMLFCGASFSFEKEELKKSEILKNYGTDNKKVHQLIDLALLQNGMLKGEALTNFVKRSIDLI